MHQALDQYVVHVQELSSLGKLQHIPEFLQKHSQLFSSVQFPTAALDHVLETFNNFEHTFAVLPVLLAKHVNVTNSDDYSTLFRQTKQFIDEANPEQLAYAIEPFCDLCHRVTVQLMMRRTPMKGIPLMLTAIGKLQREPSDLTVVHSDLCQLCLLAKCFQPAVKLLDVDITNVIKGKNQSSKGFLLYFYYGGMIYTALKKYDRAIFFFEAAVTADSHVVSHIVLEAYKKRILVSLIANGKVETLPKWTSSVVERFVHQIAKVYHDLETAYATSSFSLVRSSCLKNSEHFSRDGNTGLIKQVITSLSRKNIKKLTKTFLTLSLADVAQRCELTDAKQAERHLFNMIEDGEIFATINQKDGMVVFKDNPNKFNDTDCFLELEKKMRRYIDVNEKVRQLSEEIILDPIYLQKSSTHEDDAVAISGSAASSSSSSGPSSSQAGVTLRAPLPMSGSGWRRF